MKIGLGIVLSLFLIGSLQAFQDVEKLGNEIDLKNPPEHLKKSVLIELLRSRGVYSFPHSSDALRKFLIHSDAAPASALVPRGRSAQASSTDEVLPRSVLAPHSSTKLPARAPLGFEDYSSFQGSDYEGRLYFGFAKRTLKGEALSWNRARRNFDYYVIVNSATKGGGKLYEVTSRENCTRCHQNEAPIWVVPPWSEIISHDPLDIPTGRQTATYAKDPAVFLKHSVLIARERTPIQNNMGLALDTASSVGNRLTQSNRIISNVCANDFFCRRYIMVALVSNLAQSSYLRKMVGQISNTGVDITDLDFIFFSQGPLKALVAPTAVPPFPTALRGFQELLNNLWAKDGYPFTAQILPDPLSVLNGQATQQQLDPSTPRGPLVPVPVELATPYIFDVAFDTVGLTLQDGLALQAIPYSQRLSMLALDGSGQIPERVLTLLKNWPPTREDVLAFYDVKDPWVDAFPLPTEQAGVNPAPNIQVAQTFQTHCMSCHKDKDGENPYIPFNNLAELKKYNDDFDGVIVQRLSAQSMPPKSITKRPTNQEYDAMIKFFGTGEQNPIAQNRGPVLTNYLGVRYQNVPTLKNSYITPSAVTIVQEGVSEDCGKSMDEGPASSPTTLITGLGSDGKTYIALENFPHYFLGNIIQITSYTTANSKCMVIGVSRNGKLMALGYNKRREVMGSVPLEQENTNIPFTHVSIDNDLGMAAGRDGFIYRLIFTGSDWNQYKAVKLSTEGAADGKWTKVALSNTTEERTMVASTIEGLQVPFSLSRRNSEFIQLRQDQSAKTNSISLGPNLLDRSSLVLNAGLE